MLRKYTAPFPFDVTLQEDIIHRTSAALRQAFIQCLQNNFEDSDLSGPKSICLKVLESWSILIFTHEICVYRGCIANMPKDLNYILVFPRELSTTKPTHPSDPHLQDLLSRVSLKPGMSEIRVWTVWTYSELFCSLCAIPLRVKGPENTFEPRLHKECLHAWKENQ